MAWFLAKRLPMAMAAASTTLLFLAFLLPAFHPIEAQIGVCYGRFGGDNLPPVQDVVNLYKSNGIGSMRIYDLDEEILRAVQGSGIKLIIAVPNDRILPIGHNPGEATQFVQRYVVPYASSIKYIAVGNEVSMDSPQAPLVGPAMQNVLNALNSANLGGQIKVTTAISTSLVINSYPPSNGVFSNLGFMGPVTNFLLRNGSPLLLNVYTYFAYADPGNTGNIRLDYALLNSPYPAFTDPNNGLQYYNLFDAMVDATYAALSKVAMTVSTNASTPNRSTPRIVVSESGWPSKGGWPLRSLGADGGATLDNAGTYYRNLINHVRQQGTPLRPGPLETYLFEMFDENNKPGDAAERNFGLFYPNQQPKYQLNFRSSSVEDM